MYEAVAILVIGLTIAAFALRNGLLHLSAGMGWMCFAFLFYNVGTGVGEPFEGNDYLPTAFLMLGGVLALVCFVSALGVWMSRRTPRGMVDEQEAYKKKVLRATKREK